MICTIKHQSIPYWIAGINSESRPYYHVSRMDLYLEGSSRSQFSVVCTRGFLWQLKYPFTRFMYPKQVNFVI